MKYNYVISYCGMCLIHGRLPLLDFCSSFDVLVYHWKGYQRFWGYTMICRLSGNSRLMRFVQYGDIGKQL